jgi:hypothetical protein
VAALTPGECKCPALSHDAPSQVWMYAPLASAMQPATGRDKEHNVPQCTYVAAFAGAVSDMAALFTTEAQLRAWLLVPEHEIGNTGLTEPPLLKRAHEIMKKTAEGKGLVNPIAEQGDRVRSNCKGSDKDSVYELSVHVRDKESIDCQCTCPFAKNPVSGEAGGRSDSVQECRCQRLQLTVPLLSLSTH